MPEMFLVYDGNAGSYTAEGKAFYNLYSDIVRELAPGEAIHCNPPVGTHREIWEDPASIAVLVAELNSTFLALAAGELSQEAFRSWYGDTFQALPRRLLAEHLQRRFPAEQVDGLLLQNLPHRPDLLHALGWWMAGRASGALPRPAGAPEAVGPADPAATRALLADPFSLLQRYNATLGPDEASLRVDAGLIRLAQHGPAADGQR